MPESRTGAFAHAQSIEAPGTSLPLVLALTRLEPWLNRAQTRGGNVFSLSFLDAMTCGFGAVVLLYMVINASRRLRTGQLTGQLKAEAERLDVEVLEGQRSLVELRNSLRESSAERHRPGLSTRLIENLEELEVELATYENTTLAQREHVNKLMADLKSLEESTRRLSASIPARSRPATAAVVHRRRRSAVPDRAQGRRQTDPHPGRRLGEHARRDHRRRHPAPQPARRAQDASDKWQHALASVDWLTTQIPRDSQFQIYAFNESAWAVTPGQRRQLARRRRRASARTRRSTSSRRSCPAREPTSIAPSSDQAAQPRPTTSSCWPTGSRPWAARRPRGRPSPASARASSSTRPSTLLQRGSRQRLLFPMEGDPRAASSYWQLAMATEGSLLSLSEDWP